MKQTNSYGYFNLVGGIWLVFAENWISICINQELKYVLVTNKPTHWFQLRHKLLFRPLLFIAP